MKDTFTDANFPRTADGRVYHLGLRAGEVANRIITVGAPSRAQALATMLDPPVGQGKGVFTVTSERGFVTYTGRFGGVPVSIASIGMGYPNMDFFVREVRECVEGDLIIIRLGSCGGLSGLPVGSVAVPKAAVSVQRNFNFDFTGEIGGVQRNKEQPYHISKLVSADSELHAALSLELTAEPLSDVEPVHVAADIVNASADSFYSSQGRLTSFSDHNETLLDDLMALIPGLASLEMETFHLFHLASVWRTPRKSSEAAPSIPPPPTSKPTTPAIQSGSDGREMSLSAAPSHANDLLAKAVKTASVSAMGPVPAPRIRAAAAQMIFADRQSRAFIAPARVAILEAWVGRAALRALSSFPISPENLHEERGSVWERIAEG